MKREIGEEQKHVGILGWFMFWGGNQCYSPIRRELVHGTDDVLRRKPIKSTGFWEGTRVDLINRSSIRKLFVFLLPESQCIRNLFSPTLSCTWAILDIVHLDCFIEETALATASFVLDIQNPARSFLFKVVVLWAEFIVALWLQPAASCFDGVDCIYVLTSWDRGERNATALDPLATVEVHPNHMMTYKIGEQGVPCKTWHSQALQIQTR